MECWKRRVRGYIRSLWTYSGSFNSTYPLDHVDPIRDWPSTCLGSTGPSCVPQLHSCDDLPQVRVSGSSRQFHIWMKHTLQDVGSSIPNGLQNGQMVELSNAGDSFWGELWLKGNRQWEETRKTYSLLFLLPMASQDMVTTNTCSRTYAALPSDGFPNPWSSYCCSPSAHLTIGGLLLWPRWHAPQDRCYPPVIRLHTPDFFCVPAWQPQFVSTLERCFLMTVDQVWLVEASELLHHPMDYNHIFSRIPGLEGGLPAKWPFFWVLSFSHRVFLIVISIFIVTPLV